MTKEEIIEKVRGVQNVGYRKLAQMCGYKYPSEVIRAIRGNKTSVDAFVRIINALGWRVYVVKEGEAIEVERDRLEESI